ncbi:MAG: transporter substrate-binding domain-containing protein [Clostridia bacterium]|nr:transporter substrate-binding domain-containing protein [Clostridia bacterium]
MKKTLALIMALAMMVCLFAGCADGGEKYIIATDTAFPPFEIPGEDGSMSGIDMDILAAIAEDQGFEYEIQPLGFDAALAALEAKQCDGVIAGASITEERLKTYDFSEPYYDSGVVMAIKANNEEIKGYEDLAGKTVAAKRGTEGATFAESIKEKYAIADIVLFDESPMMYEAVKSGNAVACFEDYPVMGYGIANGNGLKMVTEKEQGSSYGFAVLKGENAELLKMFNEGLKNIKENGKYQEIIDKYISAE